ncbi:hypothetical protein Tco_0393598 [Tanacetum coccineum]
MVIDSPYYSVYEELASPEQTATDWKLLFFDVATSFDSAVHRVHAVLVTKSASSSIISFSTSTPNRRSIVSFLRMITHILDGFLCISSFHRWYGTFEIKKLSSRPSNAQAIAFLGLSMYSFIVGSPIVSVSSSSNRSSGSKIKLNSDELK